MVVCLDGDLGVGKTVFAKEFKDKNEFYTELKNFVLDNVYFVQLTTEEMDLSEVVSVFNTINTTGLDLNATDIFKVRYYNYLKGIDNTKDWLKEINSCYQSIDDSNEKLGKDGRTDQTKFDLGWVLDIYKHIICAEFGWGFSEVSKSNQKFFDELFKGTGLTEQSDLSVLEFDTFKHIVDVYEGERLAILGANGSGKSTFFLNINGVLKPESGALYYRDELINKSSVKELRKNVGIVFQDADNQIIASTVRAEVSFGPMNLGLSRNEVEKRVNNSLNYMDILHLIDRPPHYLSGGEKKRVSIADIIAMDSEIIIFDEPTASLDPQNISIFEGVLDKLSGDGKTLVISTHDLEFAFRWADRIVVFCEGNIIADADPVSVLSDEAVLKRANLKKPILLEVFESLVENKVLSSGDKPARNIDEFKKMFIPQD